MTPSDPLLGVWKYTQYCLCLLDIDLANNVYFTNFLNCLIIEFLKLGRNCDHFRTLPKDELRQELERIESDFLASYYE